MLQRLLVNLLVSLALPHRTQPVRGAARHTICEQRVGGNARPAVLEQQKVQSECRQRVNIVARCGAGTRKARELREGVWPRESAGGLGPSFMPSRVTVFPVSRPNSMGRRPIDFGIGFAKTTTREAEIDFVHLT